MLTIGAFSKFSRVSIKTLRFYDEEGLFQPLAVDPFTNYRYYSASQLLRLQQILVLKDLGFELAQIAQIVNDGVSPEQLRGMLRLRWAEQQQRGAQEQERLARVEARLNQMEQDPLLSPYEVLLKPVEPHLVASVSDVIPSYQAIGRLLGELFALLPAKASNGGCGAIWHEEGYQPSDVHAEAIVFLQQRVPERGRLQVYELPGALVASVVHQGAYHRLDRAYEALVRWVEANGYQITSDARELYLQPAHSGRQDEESTVTEIQLPLTKA